MSDSINPNAPRSSTGRLGSLSQTGNLDLPASDPVKKAKTDTLRLSPQAGETPSSGDLAQVKDLAKAVGAVQDEVRAVGELQARIQAMVPGGVKFETDGGASWKSSELKNLLEVVEGMSPSDRQSLSGLNLVRSDKVAMDAQGAEAATQQLGGDFTQGGAGASAQVGGHSSGGFMSRMGDFVRHSAEVLEGIPVLSFIGKALKSMFGTQAPERAIVLGNSGSLVSKGVWAHEIGHQVQMANRGWNPERVAEFAKLSSWTESYADGHKSAADGVNDQSGERMMFDAQNLKPTRTDNFVSAYAKTGPAEDFAESYKSFTIDPKELMRTAPDKFLFINSQSNRYTPAEVKALAQQTGVDLNQTATEMVVNSGLKQATLQSVVEANGLQPDRSAIISDAASRINQGDALSQAWAKIALASREAGSSQQLLADPKGTLGDVWNKLDAQSQAVLSDPAFLKARVADLQAGTASTRSGADATTLEIHRAGTASLMKQLLTDPAFARNLAADPAGTLRTSGLADKLPGEVTAAFANNPEAVKRMVAQVSDLMAGSEADRARYASNLAKALPALSPEHFAAFSAALNNQKDPDLAGKMLKSALETGSVVYQGGGEPPFC